MKPTEQQLQDIYEAAVSAECAAKQGVEMSSFDLLCVLDEVGGLAHFIRTLIEEVRTAQRQAGGATPRYVQPSDATLNTLREAEDERLIQLLRAGAPIK